MIVSFAYTLSQYFLVTSHHYFYFYFFTSLFLKRKQFIYLTNIYWDHNMCHTLLYTQGYINKKKKFPAWSWPSRKLKKFMYLDQSCTIAETFSNPDISHSVTTLSAMLLLFLMIYRDNTKIWYVANSCKHNNNISC